MLTFFHSGNGNQAVSETVIKITIPELIAHPMTTTAIKTHYDFSDIVPTAVNSPDSKGLVGSANHFSTTALVGALYTSPCNGENLAQCSAGAYCYIFYTTIPPSTPTGCYRRMEEKNGINLASSAYGYGSGTGSGTGSGSGSGTATMSCVRRLDKDGTEYFQEELVSESDFDSLTERLAALAHTRQPVAIEDSHKTVRTDRRQRYLEKRDQFALTLEEKEAFEAVRAEESRRVSTRILAQTANYGCTPCASGYSCPDGINFGPCDPGYYTMDMVTCKPCVAGTWTELTGSTSCITVTEGMSANIDP